MSMYGTSPIAPPKRQYGIDNPPKKPKNVKGALESAGMDWLWPRIEGQFAFGNSLEPQRKGAIRSMLRSFKPGNVSQNAELIRSRGFNAGMSQAPQRQAALSDLGFGSGAQEGYVSAGMDAGNEAANDYLGQMYSPEGQMAQLNAILGAIQSGQMTDLDQLLAIMQSFNSQPQKQPDPGPFGGLGGLFGNLLGGLF